MTKEDFTTRVEEAAEAIRSALGGPTRLAVVLGSGLGPLADRMRDRVVVPYAKIPHFPVPTVAGHPGNLVAGTMGGGRVVALQGRFHYYEGHELDAVTFPVRVLRRLGVETLILTAAAGGIGAGLEPGDLVCLTDHLNLIGQNPLRGPNDDRLGVRFPDMSEVYSSRLRVLADEEAGDYGDPEFLAAYGTVPDPE